MSDARSHALGIFQSAVDSVIPRTMVTRALKCNGNSLLVTGTTYHLDHNVHIVAFGKAAAGMVRATEDILGDHVVDGIASVPIGVAQSLRDNGRSDLLPSETSKTKLLEGATNNLPDEAAQRTASLIADFATALTKDDILIILISGGGSALLPSPIPPVTLADIAQVTKMLSRNGATIQELNIVRKHLEQLKGGGLARLAYPAMVVSLILSDVIGDPLDIIASGPTVPECSTPDMCLALFDKMKLELQVPQSVMAMLSATTTSHVEQQPPDIFTNVNNVLIGSNRIALDAAYKKAEQLGYVPFVVSCELSGDVHQMARMYHKLANYLALSLLKTFHLPNRLPRYELELLDCGIRKDTINELRAAIEFAGNLRKPLCILGGGEATVTVVGSGRGGRNQEMALLVAMQLYRQSIDEPNGIFEKFGVEFLSAGTDGQDGPTDAAGAFADIDDIRTACESGVKPEDYLANNDSYTFFSEARDGKSLVKTGFTGTNVMDVQVLLLHKK